LQKELLSKAYGHGQNPGTAGRILLHAGCHAHHLAAFLSAAAASLGALLAVFCLVIGAFSPASLAHLDTKLTKLAGKLTAAGHVVSS
jgi:hypothetical protein